MGAGCGEDDPSRDSKGSHGISGVYVWEKHVWEKFHGDMKQHTQQRDQTI